MSDQKSVICNQAVDAEDFQFALIEQIEVSLPVDVVREDRNAYGPIRDFEDLIAWQKARELTKRIYQLTKHDTIAKDRAFCSQIQRASVSVMSNIAEGRERGTLKEYAHFLSTSQGSCAEVRSLLYVACDAGYIDESAFTELAKLAKEVSRIIRGLRSAIGRAINA